MDGLKEGIAIVGMACRFPGAKNKDEFWSNLLEQKESVKSFTDEELKNFEFEWENLKDNPNFVKARGVLDDIDKWDANFFNVMPKDAEVMDPQQRLWLENTWHAFEDAGYNPFEYDGSIGVYTGSFSNTYLLNNIIRDPKKFELYLRGRSPELFQAYLNSDPMFLATRTAFFYNLKGPAINVQTACSTSLVAISQACNSLLGYETDICIAGGVTVVVPQETGYLYQEGAIGSPDGHCKPFSKGSQGTVFGNGVGTVVLKRVEDAVKDNDRIYAVIQGWATNNDGNQKAGFTAPSVEGQCKVIRMAQSFANIDADKIDYVEAHGTATPLGDPIEVAALSKAFSETTNKKQFCGLGSVKSNIGHLDAAAGVAGLIKAALSAYNNTIPATLHYESANPRINFKDSPFYVTDKNIEFKDSKPLTLAVSSFGVGGTNAHVIISGVGKVQKNVENQTPALHLLSAKSKSSLKQIQDAFLKHIYKVGKVNKEDIAYTLQLRRQHMLYRSFMVDSEESTLDNVSFSNKKYETPVEKIVFLFPGQGAQYSLMGKNLYQTEPVFKEVLDYCFTKYREITGEDISEIIFTPDIDEQLARTQYTQPALFIIEYALVKLYTHYGIKPDYCLGHSIGEYAAACVAGVFNLETALSIVIKRGQLMQKMPLGEMIAVFSNVDLLKEISNNNFEIAAVNSQTSCTISFKTDKGPSVLKLLQENNLDYVELNTSHAFHSKDFDPMLDEFRSFVENFKLNEPDIPFISCLTGDFITTENTISGEYWAKQLRNTVLFSKGVETITNSKNVLFLELGPNTHLSNLVLQNDSFKEKSLIVSSLGKRNEEQGRVRILKSLGELWLRGVHIDFEKLYEHELPKVADLPPYQFEKQRHWIDFTLGDREFEKVSIEHQDKNKTVNKNINQNNDLKFQVTNILAELSGYKVENISDEDNFVDIGFDSMFLAQFAMKLSTIFKIKIEFRQLIVDLPNITVLSEHIKADVKSKINIVEPSSGILGSSTNIEINNLALIQPKGELDPLIFVHGDNADRFFPPFLGKNQPYYGFLHLGADGEKIPFKNPKVMARAYLKQLLGKKPKGPYYLGGFSYGGILAYEMALMLQDLGHQVPKLILFDCPRPGLKEPFQWDGLRKTIRKYVLSPVYQGITKSYREAKCRYYFIRNKPLPVEKRNDYIVRKYYRLIVQYKDRTEKFKGDMLLFKVESNTSTHEYLGWDKVCSNIKMIMVKGDHENFLSIGETIDVIKENVKKFIY